MREERRRSCSHEIEAQSALGEIVLLIGPGEDAQS